MTWWEWVLWGLFAVLVVWWSVGAVMAYLWALPQGLHSLRRHPVDEPERIANVLRMGDWPLRHPRLGVVVICLSFQVIWPAVLLSWWRDDRAERRTLAGGAK